MRLLFRFIWYKGSCIVDHMWKFFVSRILVGDAKLDCAIMSSLNFLGKRSNELNFEA